jgi:hypothetical protein
VSAACRKFEHPPCKSRLSGASLGPRLAPSTDRAVVGSCWPSVQSGNVSIATMMVQPDIQFGAVAGDAIISPNLSL